MKENITIQLDTDLAEHEGVIVGMTVYFMGAFTVTGTVLAVDDEAQTVTVKRDNDGETAKLPRSVFEAFFAPFPTIGAKGECLCEDCTTERIFEDVAAAMYPYSPVLTVREKNIVSLAVQLTLAAVDEGAL